LESAGIVVVLGALQTSSELRVLSSFAALPHFWWIGRSGRSAEIPTATMLTDNDRGGITDALRSILRRV